LATGGRQAVGYTEEDRAVQHKKTGESNGGRRSEEEDATSRTLALTCDPCFARARVFPCFLYKPV
jgi:hypothetical protein